MSRVAGWAIFSARVSGISFKIPNYSGFRNHTFHVISSDFECLKRGSASR